MWANKTQQKHILCQINLKFVNTNPEKRRQHVTIEQNNMSLLNKKNDVFNGGMHFKSSESDSKTPTL